MFGRKAKRISELERDIEFNIADIKGLKNERDALIKKYEEEIANEKILRMNAEAQLERARRGQDDEANHFFRFGVKPKKSSPESAADAGTGAELPKKASKKAK